MENLALALPKELPWIQLTLTGGSTTTAVAADVNRHDANKLLQKWLYVEDTTDDLAPIGESRRITTVSGTTITVVSALSAALASSDVIRVYEHDPNMMAQALERAARHLSIPSGGLYLPIVDETLVVDNRIGTNADFETAVSGGEITGWTRTNAPTLASETTIVMHGSRSLSVAAGGSVGQLYQAITPQIKERVGKTIEFRCWVYATVASAGRIGVSYDGGTTIDYSSYHGGGDEWELLTVSSSIDADASSIRVYLEAAANQTVYFDLARAWVDRVNRYTMPTTLYTYGPHRVYQQVYENEPNGNYEPLVDLARSGRILRLEGKGELTIPATDSATIELNENQAELVVRQAVAFMMGTGEDLRAESQRYNGPMSAHERNVWSAPNESGTRYLRLER